MKKYIAMQRFEPAQNDNLITHVCMEESAEAQAFQWIGLKLW